DYDILTSHLDNGHWSAPVIAPFSGHWRDLEPAMSPDGAFMVFASSRPAAGGTRAIDGSWSGKDYPGKGGNLWRVDRVGSGWSAPVRLPDIINSSNAVFSPSIAADGSLYYMQAAGEGNHFRLFYSQYKDGKYQPPVLLQFTAGKWGGVDPAVSPDQTFMVFSSPRPPTPTQQADLFIVFHKNGKWGEPQHLGDEVNRYASNIEARLGPDGHTLYFSSGYVVPVAYPKKDTAAAVQSLKEVQGWNDGLENIWQADLAAYLQHVR
ncbi:MAG: TolB family protein, partial [Candidatus Saccharimonadales bacterium]